MWRRTSISHSRKSSVELYASDHRGFVEIAIVYAKTKSSPICPIVDRLQGSVDDIVFDQNQTAVDWTDAELPSACSSPELDMRLNRRQSGLYDTLDFLKYHLANAMNAAFEDRGFATFLKKELVGTWTSADAWITFDREGTFQIRGSLVSSLKGAPPDGSWTVGRNMLHLMDSSRLRGIRTQVVTARDGGLFLPGENGALHTIYKRAEP